LKKIGQHRFAVRLVLLEPRLVGVRAPFAKTTGGEDRPKRRKNDWLGPDHAEQIRDVF